MCPAYCDQTSSQPSACIVTATSTQCQRATKNSKESSHRVHGTPCMHNAAAMRAAPSAPDPARAPPRQPACAAAAPPPHSPPPPTRAGRPPGAGCRAARPRSPPAARPACPVLHKTYRVRVQRQARRDARARSRPPTGQLALQCTPWSGFLGCNKNVLPVGCAAAPDT